MNTQRPIRVLYLHNPHFMGGGEMSLLQLIGALDRSQCEPYVLSAPYQPFLDELASLDVPVEVCEFPPLRPHRLGAARRCLDAIRSAAQRWDVDLLHGNAPRVNLMAGLASRGRPVKAVYHVRNLLLEGDWIDLDYWSSWMADAIICNSQATHERFHRRGPFTPRTFVVPNGVDLDVYHPDLNPETIRETLGLPERALVVGTVGRLHPTKGQDTFILAAHRIVRDRNDVHFLLVGEDTTPHRSCEAHLKALSKQLGLEDRVYFMGFRSDVPQVLAAMDCFVLASIREPSGRVTQEAMACGRPVVATRSGGTVELVQDEKTGYLVPPKNPETMAQRMLELLADSALRTTMGQAARAWAEAHFGIDVHAQGVLRSYESILSDVVTR
jgi:glycosyltransferase involved in cell wall biosynthesis